MRATLTGLLLIGAIGLAFGGTVGFEFVYDDHVQIEQNPWLSSMADAAQFLVRPLWGYLPRDAGNYHRPAFGLWYAGLALLFGRAPAVFHAASLALHGAVALMLWRNLVRLGSPGAMPVALAFAVHPIQAEAVAWVAAQSDLLCALCALVALRCRLAEGWHARLGEGVACLGAILSKETGYAVAVALVLAPGGRRLRDFLAPGAALAIALPLRVHALGGLAPHDYGGQGPLGPIADGLGLLGRYALRLVGPGPAAVFQHQPPPSTWLDAHLLLGLGVAVVLRGLASRGLAGFGLGWAALTLAPALHVGGLGGEVNFAERYLYVPTLGLALAFAGPWPAGSERRRTLLLGALAAVALPAAQSRSQVYRDDLVYFSAAVAGAPGSRIARVNLGSALLRREQWAAAERENEVALRLDPTSGEAWTNLGIAREGLGDLEGALQALGRARDLAPREPVPAVRISRLHRRSGNPKAAREELARLIQRGGRSPEALADLGLLRLEAADAAGARTVLESAIALRPGEPRPHYLLAQALLRLGDPASAEREALEAIRRGGGVGPRRLLGAIRLEAGDREAARRWLREALSVAPADREARDLLAAAGDGYNPGSP